MVFVDLLGGGGGLEFFVGYYTKNFAKIRSKIETYSLVCRSKIFLFEIRPGNCIDCKVCSQLKVILQNTQSIQLRKKRDVDCFWWFCNCLLHNKRETIFVLGHIFYCLTGFLYFWHLKKKSFEIKVSDCYCELSIDFFNVFIYISERIKKSIRTCSVIPICNHIPVFYCKGTTFKGTPSNEATETSGSYELYS